MGGEKVKKKKRSRRRATVSAETRPASERTGKEGDPTHVAKLAEEIAGLKQFYSIRILIHLFIPILLWVKVMLGVTVVAIIIAVLAGGSSDKNGILPKVIIFAATAAMCIPPICVLYIMLQGRLKIRQKTAELRMLERELAKAGTGSATP